MNKNIIHFKKESLGRRSTARILKISTTTLLKRIDSIARKINRPIISKGKTYEVDEIQTQKKFYLVGLCSGKEFSKCCQF